MSAVKTLLVLACIALLCAWLFAQGGSSAVRDALPGPNENAAAARYAEAHRLDPVFAYPGPSPEAIAAGASALSLSAHAALSGFWKDPDAQESVFPLRFLASIPEAEASRRALLDSPSPAGAERYHHALLSLIAAYRQDLERASALLSKDTGRMTYEFLSGKTDVPFVRTRLTLARLAADEAEKKEERRYACMGGVMAACESAALLRLKFGADAAMHSAPQEPAARGRGYLEALEAVYPGLSRSEVVSLSASRCFAHAPVRYALYTFSSRLSSLPAATLVYADDVLFDDLLKGPSPFGDAIRRQGENLTYQPFNVYLCPDAGEDRAVALSMVSLHGALMQEPLRTQGFSPALLRLKAAEDAFVREQVPTEGAYDALVAAAALAVRAGSADSRLSDIVTETRSRSSGFDEVLGYFDDLQVGSFVPHQFQSIPPSSFIIMRGGLSELFALDNRTVLPSFASLVKTPAPRGAPLMLGGALRSYANDLSVEIPFADLPGMLRMDLAARTRAFGSFMEELSKRRAVYAH